ncbi:hypothetical protein [Oxynema aestuarii]|uniref:CRISPR-associated protein n=1 Tax=Oxynema aestuarii AP17 TaxID=2064643 RepID=A0A6H1U0I4_9CYAN|nr:hypothetical protein [Oxynema aestuarii]QIZ71670.1 hypothetical protein HCG48_14640 [Oxynema aestuarii AP17]
MNLWIVTIGSSDIQLHSDATNKQQGRSQGEMSDEIWSYWYEDGIKNEHCYSVVFEPKRAFEDKDENYRIASRVLGNVYELSDEDTRTEIFDYLTFPLLSKFIKRLQSIDVPNKIALLLTDQSQIFSSEEQRQDIKSPYWDDTCKLEPILKRYFEKEFPNVELELMTLKLTPDEQPGLDDWNKVLELVQTELDAIKIEPDTVYVSHQAGTPAISSAVQFMSLARFRNNVQFLVSNEYTQQTRTIYRSTYLGAIQRQEAQALLEQHNYAGIRNILGLTADSLDEKAKSIKYLLDAAEQWNFAEFQKFKTIVQKRKLLEIKEFPWYQSGYESAYLAVVRLEQGSTVDALFHSFRAAEGSISKFLEKRYQSHIYRDPNHGPQVEISIRQELPNYFNSLSQPNKHKFERHQKIGLYGDPLYDLFKEARTEAKNHPDIKVVWEVAKSERNNLFHRLDGLQESELFGIWNTATEIDWKARLLACLNFIAKDELAEPFSSLEEASFMAQLHDRLREKIASF